MDGIVFYMRAVALYPKEENSQLREAVQQGGEEAYEFFMNNGKEPKGWGKHYYGIDDTWKSKNLP